MPVGFECYDENGKLQFNDSMFCYFLRKTGSGTTGSTKVGNTDPSSIQLSASGYTNPIIAIQCASAVAFYGLFGGNYWWACQGSPGTPFNYYVFDRSSAIPASNFGIEVVDSNGAITFSSNYRPMQALQLLTAPAILANNPSFEQGDTQWIKEGTWTIQQSNARTGSWSGRSTGGNTALRNSYLISTYAGDQFYIEGWCKFAAGSSGGLGGVVRIAGYDSSFNEVWIEGANWIPPTQTEYQQSAAEVVVPSGVVSVRVEFVSYFTSGTLYVDDVKIQRTAGLGASVTFPGKSIAVAQGETGGHRIAGYMDYYLGGQLVFPLNNPPDPSEYDATGYQNDGKLYGAAISNSNQTATAEAVSFDDVYIGGAYSGVQTVPPDWTRPLLLFVVDVTGVPIGTTFF